MTPPPAHTHDWASDWTHNNTHHWHECLASGCDVTNDSDKDGYAAHVLNYWTVDVYPTVGYAGSMHRDCEICGYRQTSTIPALDRYPSGGGGSSSGSSSSSSSSSLSNTPTTSTKKDTDGTVTTTVTDRIHGTVTTTTTTPDGSERIVVTDKDGTVTITETSADGNKSTTVTDESGSSTITVEKADGTNATTSIGSNGRVESEVYLSSEAINTARQNNQPISLPIPSVKPIRDASAAPAVKVNTGTGEAVKITIPTVFSTPGSVIMATLSDGSRQIIRSSVTTPSGIVAKVPDGATVRVIENSKAYADVTPSNWAANAVAFVSARELFSGVTNQEFAPEAPMSRAMLMTVLARLDDVDTAGGANWYDKGMAWAVARGISDGTNPNASITREQLITMIWRYVGSPSSSGNLNAFADSANTSSYAAQAMAWAVENGVISGAGNGTLAPQAQATRAQVAQIMKNLLENLAV